MSGPVDVKVDAHELKALARDLRRVDPVMRKALPKRLRAAAEPIKRAAAARVPSRKIRTGIRVQLGSRNGAVVKVIGRSPKRPALAGLMERGSRGSGGRFIRHPVFGNRDVWVSQPTRPYLKPAVDAHRAEALREIERVVDDVRDLVRGHGG